MRFLIDVCASSHRMRNALIDQGHDVVSALEIDSRATDETLLATALFPAMPADWVTAPGRCAGEVPGRTPACPFVPCGTPAPGAVWQTPREGPRGVRRRSAAIRAFFAWGGPRRGSGCPPVIAAVQLDQHTLSGHPLAAPPVLGWAPAPRTGQSGVDQDAPQGGPADGDTLALGQQLTEMRVVGTFVLRTSQPAGAGASGLSLPVGKDQSYPAQPGVGRRHHLLAHGPGIPLPGGHHGLAQPVRGGLAIVQQLGGRLLRRRPTRDTHYHIVACGKYYPSRIPKF